MEKNVPISFLDLSMSRENYEWSWNIPKNEKSSSSVTSQKQWNMFCCPFRFWCWQAKRIQDVFQEKMEKIFFQSCTIWIGVIMID